jgi:ABC-type transport system involved in multi-copper enzyme maturation permease subunit
VLAGQTHAQGSDLAGAEVVEWTKSEGGPTVNLTLLIKELKGLKLCALLVVALSAFEVIYILASDFPDMQSGYEEELSGIIFNTLFFGLIIGVTVLSQERTQQTQSFMDGLPVSRWRWYLHKCLAGVLMMVFVQAVPMVGSLTFSWLSQTSLSKAMPWLEVSWVLGFGFIFGLAVVSMSMRYAGGWNFPCFGAWNCSDA